MDANKNICVDEIVIGFMRSMRAERKKRGYTLDMLSKITGIGAGNLSQYELMRCFPRRVGSLIKLSEALEYDISGSINYQYYHGQIDIFRIRKRMAEFGLTVTEIENRAGYEMSFSATGSDDKISLNALSAFQRVLGEAEKMPKPDNDPHAHKFICRDEVTLKFLRSMRSERLKKGLQIKELAQMLGVSRYTIAGCEKGRYFPELPILIKLAEILGCDISMSINYKYYHGEIDRAKIRRRLSFYGFTHDELALLTGYSRRAISRCVNFRKCDFSLDCLNAILELLEDENRLLKFRKELLRRKTPSRREWWKRTKAPAVPNSGSRDIWSWPF